MKAEPSEQQSGQASAYLRSASGILTDIVVWILATDLAALARYDFHPSLVPWSATAALAFGFAAGQLVLSSLILASRGRYMTGSLEEARMLTLSATAIAAFGTAVVVAVQPAGIPRSVPFLTWPLAVLGVGGVRVVKRLILQASIAPDHEAERVLVLGAGWVGTALVLRMLRDPQSPFLPVGFVDDDPAKRKMQIHGVRVLGTFDDIAAVAADLAADKIIVAINDADAALLRKASDAALELGIGCLVLPTLKELFRGTNQVQLSSLREIDVEDVIGRRPVDTDVNSIAQYVTGKRVLVTGAGGSIGSELCRQLHKFGPEELVMLDRDESALHAVELSIYGRALLDSPQTVLADIRDLDALHEVFLEHRPHVVFHAAALKHLPLLERYPNEGLKTNVYGTLNVLKAADGCGVETFVNVSTDKAANPTSALGHSKRLAEMLTAWFAVHGSGGKFLSVRFGNVLGSRGSVLHAFASQIEHGGPVTVTDPAVSRFFMTIPEACQLVIQAGAIGRGGEALVLDMGEPVKIVDVATRMISMSGKDVEIVFTGLREGEKLHEVLMGTGERDERPLHPLISHVTVPPLRPEEVAAQPWARKAARRPERLTLESAV